MKVAKTYMPVLDAMSATLAELDVLMSFAHVAWNPGFRCSAAAWLGRQATDMDYAGLQAVHAPIAYVKPKLSPMASRQPATACLTR